MLQSDQWDILGYCPCPFSKSSNMMYQDGCHDPHPSSESQVPALFSVYPPPPHTPRPLPSGGSEARTKSSAVWFCLGAPDCHSCHGAVICPPVRRTKLMCDALGCSRLRQRDDCPRSGDSETEIGAAGGQETLRTPDAVPALRLSFPNGKQSSHRMRG